MIRRETTRTAVRRNTEPGPLSSATPSREWFGGGSSRVEALRPTVVFGPFDDEVGRLVGDSTRDEAARFAHSSELLANRSAWFCGWTDLLELSSPGNGRV